MKHNFSWKWRHTIKVCSFWCCNSPLHGFKTRSTLVNVVLMMLSAGEWGRRCKVKHDRTDQNQFQQNDRSRHLPSAYNQPGRPADVRTPPGKHSQVASVHVRVSYVCVYRGFPSSCRPAGWGRCRLWSIRENIFTFFIKRRTLQVMKMFFTSD